MRRLVIILFSVVVIGILFLVLCTFVKKPYETVLLIRFGKVIEEQDQTRLAYNWYFKYPSDTVERMDTRLHLFTSPLQQTVTAGAEPISIQAFAAWRIVDPKKFHNTIQASDEQAKRTIGQKLSGLVQEKINSRRLDEIFNTDPAKVQTSTIEAEIAQEATAGTKDGKTKGVTDQGLEIVQVGFSRIAFPPANAQPVYARMAAERDTQAMAFLSEGRSQSDAIKAQGTAEATEIRAKAVAQAEQIKGDGDRQALQILASVQQSPSSREFYQYWKSMEFVKAAFTKNTYLVLSSGSDLLKPVFNAPAAAMQNPPTTQPAVSLPELTAPALTK
jgi:modulator of FtsH protease HflC